MLMLSNILAGVGGIVTLICFIVVLIRMFQRGQTGLGIVCIILFFCGGLGEIIALIMGWVKARDWGLTNVMIAYTVGLILFVIGVAIQLSVAPPGQPTLPGP